MRLKSVAKLGAILSIALFCIAAGLYLYWGGNNSKDSKDFNLYSLVPKDALCVIESDNINYYFNEISHLSCSQRFDSIKSLDLAKFILGALNEYSSQKGHGLNSKMGHILLSVHDTAVVDNQVLYLHTDDDNTNIMDQMLENIFVTKQEPKKEKYLGKKIYDYTIDKDRNVSIYKGKGYRAVSFNKSLIKKVIESQKEQNSLMEDMQFQNVISSNNSHNYLTFYCKNYVLKYINKKENIWSTYNVLIDSDVIYLTGNTEFDGVSNTSSSIAQKLKSVPEIHQDSMILTSNVNSMRDNIDKIYVKRKKGENTLFDECVANVSQDASFMMVVDIDMLKNMDHKYKPYIIPYIWNHKDDFSDFILSTQLSLTQNSLMHVIILTYKG